LSLPLAAAIVALASLVANRILAVAAGIWLHVPPVLLLGMLLAMDAIQIPFFYGLCDHGYAFLDAIPGVKKFLQQDWSDTRLARWTMPLGGPGVMLVSAMPTFGGGIWLAVFFAFALQLDRRASYAWILMGSILSYAGLFWVLDVLIRTFRFFV